MRLFLRRFSHARLYSRFFLLLSLFILTFIVLLAGCARETAVKPLPAENNEGQTGEEEKNKNGNDRESPEDDAASERADRPGEQIVAEEPAAFSPNELGQVMVLMYHEIGYPEGEWQRTPENFRRDLEILYENGYRAVNLLDLLHNNINLPAGTTPVVLTFDDSTRGQFHYHEGEDGAVLDPNSAIAILEVFNREHPDFGLAGTFYIFYPQPFRQQQHIAKKLAHLVEKAFEICNHSYSHANLKGLDAAGIQQELAQNVAHTQSYLPGYEVLSLALPYGGYPRGDLARYVIEGTYAGASYRNEAVLLVGANPAPSPYDKDFNPHRLPRIRASEMNTQGVGLYDWLTYFEKHPEKRFVSDGNPATVTVPEHLAESIDREGLGDRILVTYKPGDL